MSCAPSDWLTGVRSSAEARTRKSHVINALARYAACSCLRRMRAGQSVLVVDSDAVYGRALAALLRRSGVRVRLARTRTQALLLARQRRFDLAVVDLFLGGGGVELARELSRRVPRLLLSLGARMGGQELLEAALGFPVRRKIALPGLLSVDSASASRRRPARLIDLDAAR